MKFKQVSFAEYKDILYPLFERHWAEIVTDDKAIPIILDLEVYNTLEKDGKFITIVAEVDDKPVGYVCYVLSKLRHFAPGIVAQTDAIFLSPEYRGGRNALNMLLFAEKVLLIYRLILLQRM